MTGSLVVSILIVAPWGVKGLSHLGYKRHGGVTTAILSTWGGNGEVREERRDSDRVGEGRPEGPTGAGIWRGWGTPPGEARHKPLSRGQAWAVGENPPLSRGDRLTDRWENMGLGRPMSPHCLLGLCVIGADYTSTHRLAKE